jgi:outer membrane protein assembly factor BamB
VDLTLPLRALWRIEAGQAPLSAWRAPLVDGILILPSSEAVEAREALSGDVVWRHEVAPLSPRCAATLGDLVMVGGVAPDGTPDLVALDRASGVQRFAIRLGGVFAAPVAVDGGFVAASTHALGAFDTQGTRLWQVDFPRTQDGLPGGPALARPALLGDLVIVGAADSRLHAYSLAAGHEVWSVELPRRLLAGGTSDDQQVVVATRDIILAFTADGRERWRHAITGDPAYASPVIADDVVYAATGTGASVLALTAEKGELIWQRSIGHDCYSRPALARDHVVVGDMANRLLVIERSTGRIEGANELAGMGGVYLSDPVLADQVVGVGTADGTYHVLVPDSAPAAAPGDGRLLAVPNPFRSEVRFLEIPAGATGAELRVFDVDGRLRRRIAVQEENPTWDGADESGKALPAGIYFLRLNSGNDVIEGKVVRIR